MASLAKSAKNLKNNTNSCKFFQTNREEGTLVNTFYDTSITLIQNPDKDIIKTKAPQNTHQTTVDL